VEVLKQFKIATISIPNGRNAASVLGGQTIQQSKITNNQGQKLVIEEQEKKDIANSLNDIDKHNIERLTKAGIEEKRWIKIKISDRLSLARNTMLHRENHSFYEKGQFLLMLFILFHLHRTMGNN
jgi:hypothetical protein